jgi:hypothetical protein
MGCHVSAVLHHRFGILTYKTQKGCTWKGCWPHPWVRSLSRGGPGVHCRYPEDRVPLRTSFKSRQRLLPSGWGQLRGCHMSPWQRLLPPGSRQLWGHHVPRGSGSRLPAWGSFGAVMCHLGSNTHLLAHGSSGAATCLKDGLCRLQAIKQISSDDPAIMIYIGAWAHVSSKALRDKGCSTHS